MQTPHRKALYQVQGLNPCNFFCEAGGLTTRSRLWVQKVMVHLLICTSTVQSAFSCCDHVNNVVYLNNWIRGWAKTNN